MAKVVIENLYKIYRGEGGKDVTAVENFNLDIDHEEFVIFVGPSGCGKTTTLRMVAGLEEISKGNIFIDGRKVNDVPPKDRDIAMVFQNYALYPHMTVYKNMAFGLQLRNFPRAEIERRVQGAAKILGLSEEMLQRRPKALSGGQRQRVAVGRAIVRKPAVFLFDEPLSNLDAKMRVQMRTEISKLHARLVSTMIYVTHDQVEAMSMGDRIVVMKNGRVQQVAEPLEIYNNPCNMFVAAFIGSPAMNFFEGTIQAEGNSLFFVEKLKADATGTGARLRLMADQAKKMASFLNKDVVFGIRPENLSESRDDGTGDPHAILRARIEVVEPMGAETHLYLISGSHRFTARIPGMYVKTAKHELDIAVDMKKGSFFESIPKTGFCTDGSNKIDVESWQTACRRIE